VFEHPDFLDEDHGWIAAADCAGGKAELFTTADGGISWAHVPSSSPTCNAGAGIWPVSVAGTSTVYYTWSEPTGGFMRLYRSSDGGASFGKPTELPVAGPLVGPPSFVSPSVGWIAGFRDGQVSVERTTDGGTTWRSVSMPRVAGSTVDSIAPWEPPTFAGDQGVVPVFARSGRTWSVRFDRSSDGGADWQRGRSVSVPGRSAPSVDVVDGSTWWVASRRGEIERTDNGGASWTDVRGPRRLQIGHIDAVDGSTAWVIASDRRRSLLFRTTDGGRTWRRIRPEARPFRTVATLHRNPMGLVADLDGSIYARTMAGNGHSVIIRIDPATGRTTSSQVLRGGDGRFGADELAVFGGVIWFAGQDPSSRQASTKLVRLDADTLDPLRPVRLAAPPAAVVSGPSGAWVASGRDLLLLDAAGRILRSINVGARITHLAVDPSATKLYVSSQTPVDTRDHVVFEERSAWTGDLIASSRDVGYADLGGPTGMAPTQDGVWVSSPTGMMGTLQLFDRDDLAPVGTIQDGRGVGVYEGTNAVAASFAGGVLWIADVAIGLTCADASTGAVIERVVAQPAAFALADVIQTQGGVYASNGKEIVKVDPGSRCLQPT
jgi:photosystem II stability/assembly factor-like uncharacterized protein